MHIVAIIHLRNNRNRCFIWIGKQTKKEAPAEVFSDKLCEIFKNISFAEHLQMATSRNE